MTQDQTAEIESYGLTHVGKVREDNQDAIRICDPNDEFTPLYGHLFGIADGMGGYAHGGIASNLALTTFFDTFYASNGISIPQKLRLGVQNANLSVYQTARRMNVGRMGTTLTALNLVDHKLHLAHVGDSRAYLIRSGKVSCLTNDHTRVGELVKMRILTPDKVRTHSQRSVLSKSVGLQLFVQPDIFQVPVQTGDTIILCSDGVWSVIEDDEFAVIRLTSDNTEQLCKRIFDLAMERESDDNLSVVALYLNRLGRHPKEVNAPSFFDKLPRVLRRFSR
jgi:serine/threonine protein phosphatase PrpC